MVRRSDKLFGRTSFEQGQATSCRSRLVSLGRHRLRGVREEAELFALAPVQPL